MRVTVAIETDLDRRLRDIAHERGISYKDALNETVRRGLDKPDAEPAPFQLLTFDMGYDPAMTPARIKEIINAEDDERWFKLARYDK